MVGAMKKPETLRTINAEIKTYEGGGARWADTRVAEPDGESTWLNAAECREIATKLNEMAAWIEARR